MSTNRHQIKRMKLADLRPADYNPRAISEDALAGLGASIDRFGLVQPIVWNKRTKTVVGGHQRLKVLEARGIDEVDVVVVDLPRQEEKALNVALNSPAIAGQFTDALEGLLAELRDTVPDLYGDLLLAELQADGKGGGGGNPRAKAHIDVGRFAVMVECKDEADQKAVYQLMDEKGYECKLLSV